MDEMQWAFEKGAGTTKKMEQLVDWRLRAGAWLDILKTILAFKTTQPALPVQALLTRATPLKKDLEENHIRFFMVSAATVSNES